MTNQGQKHPSDYLNDLEEWQDKQYSPGHWTGGKIPSFLKYPKKRLGILFIILGIFSLLVVIFTSIKDYSIDNVLGNIFALIFGLIFLVGGFRIIQRTD